jgi:putative membrane protein
LPVAQVGGDVVGTRLIGMRGLAPPMAAASVVTDVFLQVATQFVFTVAALALLLHHGGGGQITANVIGGLLIAAPILLGLVLVQRGQFGTILKRILQRIGGTRAHGATDAFYEALAVVQSRRAALTASGLMHLLAWLLGSLEVWLAFQFMGIPIGIADALMIEALGHAIRGAAFAVPGGIGIQEAGLVILSGIVGIPPEQALAMSLIKRVADVALGLLGLILWHHMETAPGVPPGKSPDETAVTIRQEGTHLH